MKQCSGCNLILDYSLFYLDKRRNQPRSICKKCQKKLNDDWKSKNRQRSRELNNKHQLSFKLKNKYKISHEELKSLIKKADGKCEICLSVSTNLHIDHCHKTGKVRGLLCMKCNLGVGHFNDDVNILKKCIEYLASSGSPGR